MLTSVFTLQISFLALHKGAFSVSKGHFLAARKAFSGFEKGVAQTFFGGFAPRPPYSHRHSASVTWKPGSAPEICMEKFESGSGNWSKTNSEDWFIRLAKGFSGLH